MSYEFKPSHQYRGVTCPTCGTHNDHATGITGKEQPADGNVSVCFTCGEVSIFVNGPLGLAMREPTMDELAVIYSEHKDMLDYLSKFRAWRKAHDH